MIVIYLFVLVVNGFACVLSCVLLLGGISLSLSLFCFGGGGRTGETPSLSLSLSLSSYHFFVVVLNGFVCVFLLGGRALSVSPLSWWWDTNSLSLSLSLSCFGGETDW